MYRDSKDEDTRAADSPATDCALPAHVTSSAPEPASAPAPAPTPRANDRWLVRVRSSLLEGSSVSEIGPFATSLDANFALYEHEHGADGFRAGARGKRAQ